MAFVPGPDFLVLAAIGERQVDSYMDCQFEFANGNDKPETPIFHSFWPRTTHNPNHHFQKLPKKTPLRVLQINGITPFLCTKMISRPFQECSRSRTIQRLDGSWSRMTSSGPSWTRDLTFATLLVRPVGSSGEANSSKEVTLSKENYGTLRCVYVICERDNRLKKEFQQWMIQNNPGHEVKMISGADHMVMFSKCQKLCACPQDLARKYC
ncbi:hypothetical protein CDL12_11215 [Handroanthus impetiginosus]|uniref:Polyneuridine-aldehyde esterase n=1 Tax=Handroanthus impetiginosus TaxID=429701 RepID=A0A2G9HFB8_9LAMI|nr:hypothetical protein CDL12_11215 [Handroanthus impetiginosus]